MSSITAAAVHLRYPVYGTYARSLKRSLLQIATGGTLESVNQRVFVHALRDISFSLKAGDRVGIVGRNGAGKSTLLRLLAGVYAPDSGTLTVNGKVSAILDVALGLQPELTGYENIRLRGLLLNMTAAEVAGLIPDVESFTEMGEFLALPIKTYSSGMLIRLAFALSTAVRPEILLIDEVIGAGDHTFFAKAQKRIEHLIHQSDIIVLSSHSMDILTRLCNKIVWLEQGAVRAIGTPSKIIPVYTSGSSAAVLDKVSAGL